MMKLNSAHPRLRAAPAAAEPRPITALITSLSSSGEYSNCLRSRNRSKRRGPRAFRWQMAGTPCPAGPSTDGASLTGKAPLCRLAPPKGRVSTSFEPNAHRAICVSRIFRRNTAPPWQYSLRTANSCNTLTLRARLSTRFIGTVSRALAAYNGKEDTAVYEVLSSSDTRVLFRFHRRIVTLAARIRISRSPTFSGVPAKSERRHFRNTTRPHAATRAARSVGIRRPRPTVRAARTAAAPAVRQSLGPR